MNPLGANPGTLPHPGTEVRRAAFWSNAYAALLLLTVAAVQGVFIVRTVPGLVQTFQAANQALPLSLRYIIGASSVAPWVAIALSLAVFGIRRTRVRIPGAIGNAVLPAIAWLVVTAAVVALTLTVGQLRPNG